MCFCGGIIELGIVTALVGYIGRRIHKCKCHCHDEQIHKCRHCSDVKSHDNGVDIVFEYSSEYRKAKKAKLKKRTLVYKIIQYVLGALLLIGVGATLIGVHRMYLNKHQHSIKCNHINYNE